MSTFALSEEHAALREAVRALADDKIAPTRSPRRLSSRRSPAHARRPR
jgi:hypothetical protein